MMGKKMSLVMLIFLILFSSGCIINGRIVDKNGNPAQGVTVTLSGDPSRSTTTDSNGRYCFGNLQDLDALSEGNYTVTPSKAGYSFNPYSIDVVINEKYEPDWGEDVPWPVTKVDFEMIDQADALNVPGDYATIQDAIDAASVGEVVLVADGTYTGEGNKDLDFGGKAITVLSRSGPENCIIDCGNEGRGFYFQSGEGKDSVVSGFTITNGSASNGGGIRCSSSSPTIVNCIIKGNLSTGFPTYGGGIYCYNSSAAISNCSIVNNESEYWGGGIFCRSESSLTITDCTVTGNSATYQGGGIYCYYLSTVTISNCTIDSNSSRVAGGLCFAQSSTASITNCTITGNESPSGDGGGIYANQTNLTATNCIIKNNSAYSGSGIYCGNGDEYQMVITNCIISGNVAESNGGGIYCFLASPAITNCTMTQNEAGDTGAGIYAYYQSYPTITNCILWDDSSDEISTDDSTPVVTYSDIQGGYEGEGNINVDPLFVGDGDYHLTANSPCIDTGTQTGAPDTDLEGNDRPLGTAYDMGAYEYH